MAIAFPAVIAEIGSNHGNSLQSVKKLIDGAKEAGCAYVKFQLFFPDEFIPSHVKAQDYGLDSIYGDVAWQKVLNDELIFPHHFYPEVKKICADTGIGFGVTVHGERSLDIARSLNVDFIKIASMDLNYYQLLNRLRSLSCPILLSTGMAELSEIEKAVQVLGMKEKDVLMHCTSEYPAVETHILRLNAFKHFGSYSLGYSDHTEDSVAAIGAVGLGAKWFEKHITLDKSLKGPDHGFAANLAEMKQYVSDLHKAFRLFELDQNAGISPKQLKNRTSYRRSIVAARDLLPGMTVTKADIDFKRPGNGFDPSQEELVVGSEVKLLISKDQIFTKENLAISQ